MQKKLMDSFDCADQAGDGSVTVKVINILLDKCLCQEVGKNSFL
jgi:hypothetical protein